MIYNEQQLESFCKARSKHEVGKAVDTHQLISEVITQHFDKQAVIDRYDFRPDLEVYLQGSYKNDTDVTRSSDVDVVVQVSTIWRDNKEVLPPEQRAKYEALHSTISYTFNDFRQSILNILQNHFGHSNIIADNKCIRVKAHGRYCNADVVPCFTYRHYGFFESVEIQEFKEGMWFTSRDGREVVNFPEMHFIALTQKSKDTDGRFKQTVRMFKNMRDDLVDKGRLWSGVVKSYHLENLLHYLPNECFLGSRQTVFSQLLDAMNRLWSLDFFPHIKCANGVDKLIGGNNWQYYNAKFYLETLNSVRHETQP